MVGREEKKICRERSLYENLYNASRATVQSDEQVCMSTEVLVHELVARSSTY
jgi:hypothetical protein